MASVRDSRARGARYSEAGAALFALLQELDHSRAIWPDEAVSRGRLATLRVLATRGPMTISEVARERSTSRQGVQRLASVLVEEGWLIARQDEKDRRTTRLELTEAGIAAYHQLAHIEAERLNDIARGSDVEELRQAARLLKDLREKAVAKPDR